jgi:hypothetical protein
MVGDTKRGSIVTTREQLNKDLDRLGETALRIKAERDALLAACKRVYAEIDDRYEVEQFTDGDFKEYPCSGAGGWMRVLKAAIDKTGAA